MLKPQFQLRRCLVFDLGAGSGRAMLAELAHGLLTLKEVHRFDGLLIQRADGPHWDAKRLLLQVEESLRRFSELGFPPDSIGVDSWGLDYALLDKSGRLMGEPYQYRHKRWERGRADCVVSPRELFLLTGAQDLPMKTLYQLIDECRASPTRIRMATSLLMIADLVTWHLTGQARAEITLAGTSGMLDRTRTEWCVELCERVGIPPRLLAPLIEPGTRLGLLRRRFGARFGWGSVPVIAVAAHDTASAVAALPLSGDVGFLICGSWLLLGLEEPIALFDESVQDMGFGYESGLDGRAILVKSLNGLHLIQKLKQAWAQHSGHDVEYASIAELASQAREDETTVIVDTTDPIFFDPPNIIEAIQDYCARNNFGQLNGLGSLALALYCGIAEEVAKAVASLRASGREIATLILCGGGVQDRTLCQLIADLSGCEIQAGPVEASALGNALVQLLGLGAIDSLQAGRDLVLHSVEFHRYLPISNSR